jgi:hypothetical protein
MHKSSFYNDRRVPGTKCELLPMIKQTLVQAVSLEAHLHVSITFVFSNLAARSRLNPSLVLAVATHGASSRFRFS